MSLVTSMAFQPSSAIQTRAFIVVGTLATSDVDDDAGGVQDGIIETRSPVAWSCRFLFFRLFSFGFHNLNAEGKCKQGPLID
jgi:hypothetical protein